MEKQTTASGRSNQNRRAGHWHTVLNVLWILSMVAMVDLYSGEHIAHLLLRMIGRNSNTGGFPSLPPVRTSSHFPGIHNLSEVAWTVSNEALNISVPGSLPSHVHLDLYRAQVIGDPYYGLNDFNLRWVALNNWTYAAELPLEHHDGALTYLLFQGLDTFTSIDLCGQHVASTNNQFRQYHFDITHILSHCHGPPLLSINFGSVPKIADEIAAQPGQETWPYGIEGLFEFPNRQFVRKEQSDFGWDWGPAFVPVGPWLPAYALQLGRTDVYIRNSLVDIYRVGQLPLIPPDQSQPWVINASLDVIRELPKNATIAFILSDGEDRTIASGSLSNITVASGTITGSTIISPSQVELWWPTGLGPQTLYTLSLTIITRLSDYTPHTATVKKRVGFRTIVLNQEPIRPDQLAQGTAPGNNWHFEINGHEFYAKGANLIPPDTFWPRVTKKKMRDLFESVVGANMNMLRVWSSGVYLEDWVYDIADELGILLWSEFQFGDALYPVDEEFLDNVREEAVYQVRRVNHHPSLALWAGGNELELLELPVVKRIAPELYPKYLAEYEQLFLDILAVTVFENSRSISYTPSSSGNGWQSLNFSNLQPITQRYDNVTEGHIYGNTDYYNYDSSFAFNTSSYPVGRFSNEFGYHSMPSLQSWRQAVAEEDLHFNSSTITLRNHHYPAGGLNTSNFANSSKGMAEMTLAVQRWYPTPQKTGPIANFSSWCHVTQIFQADYYKSQIQFYRRGSGMRERQLGALYWQLEDIWQAPTWAGIEYDGRWKVVQHVVKDIYRNVIVSPFYDVAAGELEVWVTSDLWEEVRGEVRFGWFDWGGNELGVETPVEVDFTVGAVNTTRVLRGHLTGLLSKHDPRDVILRMDVSAQAHLPNNPNLQTFTHTNWFHTTPLSQAHLVDPELQLRCYGDSFSVRASKGVAAWVWLNYPAGSVVQFSENGFWLAKGEEKTITWKVVSGVLGEEWARQVSVESLWDMGLP